MSEGKVYSSVNLAIIIFLLSTIQNLPGRSIPYEGTRDTFRSWLYEPIEEVQGFPGYMIMLLDGEDQPHMIYGTDNGLTHAMFDGDSWSREHVQGTTNMTWDVSAALDRKGQPHIAFYSYGLGLNHSWKDDEGWHSITVDYEYQSMPSIGVGSNGLVHIAYRAGNQLRYAECNGTTIEIISPGTGNFYGISLAIDSSDRVCISASNRSIPSFGKLEFFQRTPFGWGRSTIPEGEGAFSYTVLRFDSMDRPFICYTVRTTKDRLDMVFLNGAAWSHSTADDEMNKVLFDFHLGQNDAPNIITDNYHGQLSGTKWVFTDIDLPGLRWSPQCMDFDPLGNVHLAVVVGDDNRTEVAHAIYGFDIERPVADAGDDRDLEFGDRLELDGSMSSDDTDISRWQWTIQVGSYVLKREGVLVGLDTFMMGPHNITLRAIDTSGNFDDDRVVVTVRDMTDPLAIAGDDVIIDQHNLVQFNGTRSTDRSVDLNFTWEIAYVTSIMLYGPDPLFTFDEAGSFEVVLSVRDQSGNIGSDSMMVTVLDTTAPYIIKLKDRSVPQFSIIFLDASACTDNTGIEEYNWTIVRHRSTRYVEGVNASLLLDEAGEYDIILTIKDVSGNGNSTSFSVLCLDREPPIAGFDCPRNIISGDELELDGGASTDNLGIVEWSWLAFLGKDTYKASTRFASFKLTVPGNYTITLTVNDSEGNSGSITKWVTVLRPTGPDRDGDDEDGTPWPLPLALVLIIVLSVIAVFVLFFFFRKSEGSQRPVETPTPTIAQEVKVVEMVVPVDKRTKVMSTTKHVSIGTFGMTSMDAETFDGRSGRLEVQQDADVEE